MRIKGSTFLVSGGASGLGEAVVKHFHGSGARVVVADLNADLGQALVAELGEGTAFVRTDVTSEADVQAAIALAGSRFGGFRGVVHCAGIGNASRILGKDGPQSLASFSQVINVNLIGAFNVLRLAAAAMAEGEAGPDGERGVVINTASVAAFEGQIGQAAYSASKAGIVAMALPAARELARFGIRVNTIAPGLFLTPMMYTLPPDIRDALGKATPFPARLGQPEEFARLAAHITENTMINGEVIRLDGAMRLAPR